MTTPRIEIGDKTIGLGHPVYVIAEVSANHNGSLERAKSIVRAAADAGADAVKLQTYTAESITIDSELPHFQIDCGSVWDKQSLFQLYQKAHTPRDWHAPLQALATELGLDFFSTPFDETAVEFLESIKVPCYKVASFEIVDLPLLEKIASTRKPVIMSTGMATIDEIQAAMNTLRENGCTQVALLKCTSAYPATPASMNLKTIAALQQQFDVVSGLSDHSLGHTSAVASTALGSCIIEKHLTLRRSDGGPDSHFSMEPEEFAEMVTAVRQTSASLGEVHFGPTEFDQKNKAFRPSLFAIRDIQAGEVFSRENVDTRRPASGLPPVCLKELMGQTASQTIPVGTPVSWDLVQVKAA